MPWIDYDALSRPKKILVWVLVVAAAVLISAIVWLLGFREVDVPTVQ